LGKRVRATGSPQTNGAGAEVDIIRKVVPVSWLELRRPVCHFRDHPTESVVRSSPTAERAVFEFGEVALLEEMNVRC
jgi:hypothetical protein